MIRLAIICALTVLTSLGQGLILVNPFWSAPAGNGLLDGLVAYYSCEESSGSNLEDELGLSDLTATGTWNSTAGRRNLGRVKTADTDFFSHADSATFEIGSDDYTIAFWIKFASVTASEMGIISKDTSINILAQDDDGDGTLDQFEVPLNGNLPFGGNVVTAPSAIDVDAWHLVVFRRNFTAETIQLDVIPEGAASISWNVPVTFTQAITDNDHALIVGGYNDGADGLQEANAMSTTATIDGIGFWRRCLSDDDVTLLFNSGNGLAYTNFN